MRVEASIRVAIWHCAVMMIVLNLIVPTGPTGAAQIEKRPRRSGARFMRFHLPRFC